MIGSAEDAAKMLACGRRITELVKQVARETGVDDVDHAGVVATTALECLAFAEEDGELRMRDLISGFGRALGRMAQQQGPDAGQVIADLQNGIAFGWNESLQAFDPKGRC